MRRPTGCQSNPCNLLGLKIRFPCHGQPSEQRRTSGAPEVVVRHHPDEVSPPARLRRRTLLLFHSGRHRLAIPAVDIAIFIFGTNPLVPSRPVVITIAVSRMFTPVPVAAISVVTIPVPISIISPTLVFPFTVAAISITVAAFAAISIAVAVAAFAARSLPFVGLLHLLL